MFYSIEWTGEKKTITIQQRIKLSHDLWWNSIFTGAYTDRQKKYWLPAWRTPTGIEHKGNASVLCFILRHCDVLLCFEVISLFAHNFYIVNACLLKTSLGYSVFQSLNCISCDTSNWNCRRDSMLNLAIAMSITHLTCHRPFSSDG